MKKLLILSSMLFLIGCNHTTNMKEEPINNKIQPLQNETDSIVPTEDSTLEETMMNNQRAEATNENYFLTNFLEEMEPIVAVSTSLAKEIQTLSEVAKAQVILFGDKAYVALKTTDVLSPTVQAQIENIIQTSQANINDILIITDQDLVNRFNLFVEKIENNAPLKEWYVDFSTSIENVFEPEN